MKNIQLTQGKFALVDDDDFEWLNQWKWFYHNGYALRREGWPQKEIYMHKVIVGASIGMEVDHRNLNRSDNRRCNLRLCSRSENMANRGVLSNNTSGHKGVSFDKCAKLKKWRSRLSANGKNIDLGRFLTAEEAAYAYDKAAEENHGEFARKNYPNG